MIIIVEGIDRVGKTTLCNNLAEALGYKVFKDDSRYAGITGDVSIEKANSIVNLMELGVLDNIVIDRFHFSEMVYGHLERDEFNCQILDICMRVSNLNNVIMIHMIPEDIERSSAEHGSFLGPHFLLFKLLFESFDGVKVVVDYSSIKRAVKVINEEIIVMMEAQNAKNSI